MSRTSIKYKELPNSLSLISKTLFKSQTNIEIPLLNLTLHEFNFKPAHLARYQQYCGFPAEHFPLPYLFVASQKAQLALLSDPRFPLKILGLIHTRIHFFQNDAIVPSTPLDITVAIGKVEHKDRGIEFELQVRFLDSGKIVCGFDSHYFSITHLQRANKPAPILEQYPSYQMIDTLSFSEPDVRGYARISGDYNPIHLHRITAAPFGFKHPIAHGMYLLARSMVSLEINPASIAVQFKRPALLPTHTQLLKDGQQAVLLNAQNKPLLDLQWRT
ncbi:hypothetical protein VHA01S_004_00580 [Vibrio halioticoli NBRC 102217]|uniref:MaoC-like domain-containing protein n=1 Tax=Vibrio halioticoli NBRC 102217 TaxID=1219072 RepID=V5EZN1_9VIBR|nr:MaoC/PaaZ C-terminal domain-containing protein [Vibrio halioticoli]GAD88284.1 hypothetical protein VHA01S_004_00580 [Vibrio halioticoli NBRC 102217]